MSKLITLPDKICPVCGKAFNRRLMPNGRLQTVKHFKNQTHCSRTCGNTREVLTKHGYSWRARKHLKQSCEACGYEKKLQAHHIDQDKTNNDPDNIQTLCKHCHDFWHTMAKRIGKEVAGRMPPLVGGKQSQTSEEWLMAWPLGFTDSKHWATVKSRSKRQSRGNC